MYQNKWVKVNNKDIKSISMDVIAWNVFILQIYKKRKSSVKIIIKKNTRKATGLMSIFLK